MARAPLPIESKGEDGPLSTHRTTDPMPAGRGIGICLAVIGVLATVIAWWLLESRGSAPRIFVGGPAMAMVGIAMMILPGSRTVSASDPKAWMRASPWLHKLAWIASGLIGLFVAFRYLLHW